VVLDRGVGDWVGHWCEGVGLPDAEQGKGEVEMLARGSGFVSVGEVDAENRYCAVLEGRDDGLAGR